MRRTRTCLLFAAATLAASSGSEEVEHEIIGG
jgi:hypothetical protein